MARPEVNGRRVRLLREERGWSQGELARRAGVSQGHLSNIERGVRRDTQIVTAARIAKALGVPTDDLLVGPRRDANDLPEFSIYVARKFWDRPKLRRSLEMTWEAMRDVEEDVREKNREEPSGK